MTLVEVILAVAILSAGLTVLLTGVSRCLAVMKKAKNYQVAQWTLGLGNLEYPLLKTNEVEKLAVDPVEYPNGFTFQRIIEEPDDEEYEEEEDFKLFVVRTRVSWSDRGRDSFHEVVRYVLQREQ